MKKLLTSFIALPLLVSAQQKDKATFIEVKPGYYQNSILKGVTEFEQAEKPAETKATVFKVDLSGKDLPVDPAGYTKLWHTNPVSQGNTGTCWCYSTTS